MAGPSESGCPYAGRCPHTMDICRQQMPPLLDYRARIGQSAPHWAACHWVEQTLGAGTRTDAEEKARL